MSGSQTAGFDIVLDMAQDAVATAIGMAGVKGPRPPDHALPIPVTYNTVTGAVNVVVPYTAKLGVLPPTPDLTQPPPGPGQSPPVVLTAPISTDSALTPDWALMPPTLFATLKPILASTVPIAGTVTFACPLEPSTSLVPSTTGPGLVTAESFVASALDGAVAVQLSPGISDLGIPGTPVTATSSIQDALQNAFANDLKQEMGQVPLTVPVGLNAGPTPARTVASMLATLLPVVGGKGALGVGMASAAQPPSVGHLSALTQPSGLTGIALLAANEWFVRCVAEMLQTSFGISPMTVDPTVPSATWSGPPTTVTTPSGSFSLTSLTLAVATTGTGGLTLGVTGAGTASGFCWSATIGFTFSVTIGCDPSSGTIAISSTIPIVTHSVSIPLWCIIVVGLIVGLLVGLVFGVVAGVIAGVIAAIVVASMGPPLPSGLGTLSSLVNFGLPLPISSIGLQLASCSFDDVAMFTTPAFVDSAPQLAHGILTGGSGTSFDLDAGTSVSGGAVPSGADLFWTGTNLEPQNGATLRRSGEAFDQLTYGLISRLAFSGSPVVATAIPDRSASGVSSTASLVVGVRTSSARYAKFAAWRNGPSSLTLNYVTYADPAASLVLQVATEQVTDSHVESDGMVDCDSADVGIHPAAGTPPHRPGVLVALPPMGANAPAPPPGSPTAEPGAWHVHVRGRPIKVHVTVTKVAYRILLRTVEDRLDVPIHYTWIVFGQALPSGGTTHKVDHLAVNYEPDSPFLEILSKRGDDVVGDVQVTATDASGRTLQATLHLDFAGEITSGGCPPSLSELPGLHSVFAGYGGVLGGQLVRLEHEHGEQQVPTKLPPVKNPG